MITSEGLPIRTITPLYKCSISLFLSIGTDRQNIKRKIVIIFLPISLNIGFGCSKEPSHRDGSFEYPQHMLSLRNKKNNFQARSLIGRLVYFTLDLLAG